MSSCFTYPSHSKTSQFRVGLPAEAFSHKPPLRGAVVPVPPLKREPFLCVLATEELSRADKGQIRRLKASGRLHYQRQLLEGNLTTSDLNKKSQWFNSQVVGLKLNDIFAFVKVLLKEPHRTAFLKDAKIALLRQFDSSDSDSRWCGASMAQQRYCLTHGCGNWMLSDDYHSGKLCKKCEESWDSSEWVPWKPKTPKTKQGTGVMRSVVWDDWAEWPPSPSSPIRGAPEAADLRGGSADADQSRLRARHLTNRRLG